MSQFAFAGAALADLKPYVPSPYIWGASETGDAGGNGRDAECYNIFNIHSPDSGDPGQNANPINESPTVSGSSPAKLSGVVVQSVGGKGGNGGDGDYCYGGRGGGRGGDGGSVTVTYGSSSTTPSAEVYGVGFFAMSKGGNGGQGGSSDSTVDGGDGGYGGNGGSVVLKNYAKIISTGANAPEDTISFGIFAASIGGLGGNGGNNGNVFDGGGGNGKPGGTGGSVNIENHGSVSTGNAYGIMGVSLGGYGGTGGDDSWSLFPDGGGSGSYGGTGGDVTISNSGSVTTSVGGRIGIIALSVGGGGGDAGSSAGIGQLGSTGGPGAQGGALEINNSGSIRTTGPSSPGLFAASVGGGGGNGGMAGGITAIGGSGGDGGIGNTVKVVNSGSICTGGDCGGGWVDSDGMAPGLAALSVGGGGGNGSYGVAASLGASVGIGGSGGGGGNGGRVLVAASGSISTREYSSPGILAASVGGGGGNGGGALSLSAGFDAVGVAVGGSGGNGGAGGQVVVNCSSSALSSSSGLCGDAPAIPATSAGVTPGVWTAGDQSPGILAASVGGGGGRGGFAVALAAAMNTTQTYSVGGSGGAGGAGAAVYAASNANAPITTNGIHSPGLMGISVGGGGGVGGATFYTPWYTPGGSVSFNTAVSTSIGGSGGSGGAGGAVTVENPGGTITTNGDQSSGILAASVGGGGGVGGFGAAGSVGVTMSVGISIGGNGGSGNRAGDVTVENSGDITANGQNSRGVLAVSVGGGGGVGGVSAAAGLSIGTAASFAVGGKGGMGGDAGAVNVTNSGDISVLLSGGAGLAAASIGGGGGAGGVAASASVAVLTTASSAVGGNGGGGATAGKVTVTNSGAISIGSTEIASDGTITVKSRRTQGVIALSVGGGGGMGGLAVGGGLSGVAAFTDAVGGGGSSGGRGGEVEVTNAKGASITTIGDQSSGIVAMSIGGRGGLGGTAVAAGVADGVAIAGAVGSGGGAGGASAKVTVTNNASITTEGLQSYGLVANSIGGHGGAGGVAVGGTATIMAGASVTVGGPGGDGGVAGATEVTNNGAMTIKGSGGAAVFASSVGGSGGVGGQAQGLGLSLVGSTTSVVGGTGAKGGTAGDVKVTNKGLVTIGGANTRFTQGLMALSIGGSGGMGGLAVGGGLNGTGSLNDVVGGGAGDGGKSGLVTIDNAAGAGIVATGDHANGIIGMSIGGRGGMGGSAVSAAISTGVTVGATVGSDGGKGGVAGGVTITNEGGIQATGLRTHAIMGFSIGGSGGHGGLAMGQGASLGPALAINVGGAGGEGGVSGLVDITNRGLIGVSGSGGAAIFAASMGGDGGAGGAAINASLNLDGAFNSTVGGSGGKGATAGDATVTNYGGIQTGDARQNEDGTVSLQSRKTPGILAMSIGGGGGRGGLAVSTSVTGFGAINDVVGGTGADGGTAGTAKVVNAASGAIQTFGDQSNGVTVMSIGGRGGMGGTAMGASLSTGTTASVTLGGDGGKGGKAGLATIENSGVVYTTGVSSVGLMAQSIGGHGGMGGFSAQQGISAVGSVGSFAMTLGGKGGDGGESGTASIKTYAGADVVTRGASATAILAQAIGGSGGMGGMAFAASITTAISPSMTLGGDGGSGANGGVATVTSDSNIITAGVHSSGIVAQSIGANGGMAGITMTALNSESSPGGSTYLGATSGDGGKGGAASVVSSGTVRTIGFLSDAVVAESIGGGGGRAALSITAEAPTVTNYAIESNNKSTLGSKGGAGGDGGTASVTTSGNIHTLLAYSSGVYAQSVGGGGGSSTTANGNVSYGSKNIDLVQGGAGGSNGSGGEVTVKVNVASTTEAPTIILTGGVGSHAVFAQSVGAGGGRSGVSNTQAAAGGLYTASQTLGSSGTSGGSGGAVTVEAKGIILTRGLNASGLLAQSVGGGGGESSSLFEATTTLDYQVPSTNLVLTSGGGSGQNANASSGSSSDAPSTSVSLSRYTTTEITASSGGAMALGGFSGVSGNGGDVTVNSAAAIRVARGLSYAIEAHSIGGGGGRSNLFDGNSGTPQMIGSHTLGGGASGGGDGGVVKVTSYGPLSAGGGFSGGVLAQSIGGGGGIARQFGLTDGPGVLSGYTINLGSLKDGASGKGGAVTVKTLMPVLLGGFASDGVVAQSIGGGGGLSTQVNVAKIAYNAAQTASRYTGSASAGTLSGTATGGTNSASSGSTGDNVGAQLSMLSGSSLAATLGAAGGSGRDSSAVSIVNTSTIAFLDDGDGELPNGKEMKRNGSASTSILAQSIAAGGGVLRNLAVNFDLSQASHALTLGAASDATGAAGSVTVVNNYAVDSSGEIVSDPDTLWTMGKSSPALVAQSIGGGGGAAMVAQMTDQTGGSVSAALTLGATGTAGGAGGAVTVQTGGSIETHGDGSDALVAQSIGGGGGYARLVSAQGDSGYSPLTAASAAVNANGGTSASTASGLAFAAMLGAVSETASNAGAVNVVSGATIRTGGTRAIGLLAQSVGGGGGVADVITFGTNSGGYAGGVQLGGKNSGSGGAVSVAMSGSISTGDMSAALIAQSIGGGGGVSAVTTAGTSAPGAGSQTVTFGSFSAVTATSGAVTGNLAKGSEITTSGSFGARGALFQSIAGGGGLAETVITAGGASTFSNTFAFGGAGTGKAGAVSVTSAATIETEGFHGTGLAAQSIGGGGGVGMAIVNRLGGGDATSTNSFLTNTSAGAAGSVTLTVTSDGDITANGPGSVGVLAQSVTAGGDAAGRFLPSISGVGTMTYRIGAGGSGASDFVRLSIDSKIATDLEQSAGVIAQSVAQGGNYLAHMAQNYALSTLNLTVALGSSGQATSSYVSIGSVGYYGSIVTKGVGSPAIIAQSIGGGGGNASFLSGLAPTTSNANITLGSSSASAGNAWAVDIAGARTISTTGAYSSGVIAQAIGGGGGRFAWKGPLSGSLTLGGSGAGGHANNVVAATSAFTNANSVSVTLPGSTSTQGVGSFGVLAQSIGGGGGFADGAWSGTARLGGGAFTGSASYGSTVSVNVSGVVSTMGESAIGIIAQSIGGGGGVAFGNGVVGGATGSGLNGGNVTVTISGTVSTSGKGAAGVVAQSVGGGGGLLLNASSSATATSLTGQGNGGVVTVNLTGGKITTTGAYAHGVVAQSGKNGAGILSNMSGFSVIGSSGSAGSTTTPTIALTNGASISVLGTGASSTKSFGSTVSVDATSSLTGAAGTGAVVSFVGDSDHHLINAGLIASENGLALDADAGVTTAVNSGRLSGGVALAAGANLLHNTATGVFDMGASVDLGGGTLRNEGQLIIDNAPRTVLRGDLTQSASGVMRMHIDMALGQATWLSVTGSAQLDGQIAPYFVNGRNLRNGSYVVPELLRAEGGLTLAPTFSIRRTAIVTTSHVAGANGLGMTAQVDFAPNGLTGFGRLVGVALGRIQAQGGAPLFARIVDVLVNIESVADLDRAYGTLTSHAVAASQEAALGSARRTTDAFADRADRWRRSDVKEEGLRVWASPFAGQGHSSRDGASLSTRSFGGVAGVDSDLGAHSIMGFGAAIGQSRLSYAGTSWGTQDSGGAAVYGLLKTGDAYFSGVGYAGAARSDLSRAFGPLYAFGNGAMKVDATLLAGRFEVGRSFRFGDFEATPFAAFAPVLMVQRSATETVTINGDGSMHAGVRLPSQNATSLPVFLGVQFGLTRALQAGGSFNADLRLAWRHEFSNVRKVEQEFAAAPGFAFTRQTSFASRDALDLKLRADWRMPSGLRLFGEVGATLAPNANSVTARGGLQATW